MVFKIEKALLNLGGGVYTGVVVAYGLDNATPNDKIAKLLASEISRAHTEFHDTSVKNSTQVAAYQQAMREVGIKPSRYPCSIEAILTRIAKQGEFPSISPVVDLGNYISLKYRVPVGVHDIDSLVDNTLCIRLATEEDCKNEDPEGNDVLKVGEAIYASGNSARTRRWLWRQLAEGRVTESTANFIFPIDGFVSNKETISSACEEMAALLQELFGVTAEVGKIDQENSEFHFGPLSDGK